MYRISLLSLMKLRFIIVILLDDRQLLTFFFMFKVLNACLLRTSTWKSWLGILNGI